MDLESILTVGLTKKQNQELNEWVGHSQANFDRLMFYFLHEEMRLCQRASWVFAKVCEDRPHLMLKWIPAILEALNDPKHDAIIRNTVRAFQYFEAVPEEFEGEIYERCFNYLIDHDIPIAVKAFSMTVCRKVAMRFPDLKPELIAVIEDLMNHGSAGIKSRGAKEVKKLSQ